MLINHSIVISGQNTKLSNYEMSFIYVFIQPDRQSPPSIFLRCQLIRNKHKHIYRMEKKIMIDSINFTIISFLKIFCY